MGRKRSEPSREKAQAEVGRQALELGALNELLGSRRRLMWVNFLAGLARGVGFFLGVSLVGGFLIALLALVFDTVAHTLGVRDFTLKDAVRVCVVRFEEIRREVQDVQTELAAQRAERAAETTPPPPTIEDH